MPKHKFQLLQKDSSALLNQNHSVTENAGGQGGINPPLYLNQVGVNTNLFLVIARTKEMFLTISKNTG